MKQKRAKMAAVALAGVIALSASAALSGCNVVEDIGNSISDLISKLPFFSSETSEQTYSVSFSAGTGASGSVAAQTAAAGESLTLPDGDGLKKEGYVFAGWSDGEQTYAAGETYVMPANNVTLTAVWKKGYTVTYVLGEGETFTASVIEGNAAEEPPKQTKTGYVVSSHWYTDEVLTEEYDFTTILTDDLVLYAEWIESTAVSTAEELKAVADNPEGNYHLTCDINLHGDQWSPVAYSGVFNGMGYSVTNFTMAESSAASFGFFSANSGEICDLTLANFAVTYTHTSTAACYSGVLVGLNSGRVENCAVAEGDCRMTGSVTVSVSGSASYGFNFGGVVGQNEGTIAGCENDLDLDWAITGTQTNYSMWVNTLAATFNYQVGGICGSNSGVIADCENRGDQTVTNSAVGSGNSRGLCYLSPHIGGVAGANGGVCARSSSDGSIQETDSQRSYGYLCPRIGLLIGENSSGGTVSECAARGSIALSGTCNDPAVGGMVGINNDGGSFSDCYAAASISTEGATNTSDAQIGGFAGRNGGTITRAYCVAEMAFGSGSGNKYFGGMVGYNASTGAVKNAFASFSAVLAAESLTGNVVGTNANGTIWNCYYADASAFVLNEETLTEWNNTLGEAQPWSTLISRAFLAGEDLAWEESVWAFSADAAPVLQWEAQR